MTDRREATSRLEGLAARGAYDTVRKALERGNPVLDELAAFGGISREKVTEALGVEPRQLEAVGVNSSFLEAIVKASGRPPLAVANGKVEGKQTLRGLDGFPEDIDGQIAQVEHLLPSVGRVEFRNHDMSWGGTGWLVGGAANGERLMVTNRHVARIVAQRRRDGSGIFLPSRSGLPYGAELDLGEESGVPSRPEQLLPIERFTYIADDISADVALARVTASEEVWAGLVPLDPAEADGEDDEIVAVVGYPAADGFRNDPTEMERYFRGLYDVKRFAPGRLRVRPGVSVLGHDCTTLGGNSGSPVISLSRKAVVGLHYAGEYGIENSAVRIGTVKGLLAGTGGGGAGPGGPSAPTEARDGAHDSAFFAERRGYDPEFLQVASVPLPMPSGPALDDLARPDDATGDRPHELRYQHFGVLYSTLRKGPLVAAHNVDGARFRPVKRGNDVWFHDLRIPRAIQLDQASYGDAAIDRGHMVRRADTNWGDSDEEARRADLDSFHYTNASPQHAGLNRSRDLWLGLEDYLLGNVRTHGFRACVFTGPAYADTDPEFGSIVLPLSFWKVVAMLAADESDTLRLHATAYLLSQGQLIQDLLAQRGVTEAAEGFAFSAYKTFQVRVADVAELTGLDFGPLVAADPLAGAGAEEAPGARSIVQLEALAQIVV